MAVPKGFTGDRSGITEPRMPTSSGFAIRPNVLTQEVHQIGQPYVYFSVGFLGRAGSGRNSLAWRMENLDESKLPELEFKTRRQITLETGTRPSLLHTGVVNINIRIVPPEELEGTPNFFTSNGEIHQCNLIVYVVDVGDDKSSNDFYTWFERVKRCNKQIPALIVGNKVDLRLFTETTPYTWGEGVARHCSARYMECSAKTNDRVGDVLDAMLRILL